MIRAECKICGENIYPAQWMDSSLSPWTHKELWRNGDHHVELREGTIVELNSNPVDLHTRITDLLMEGFIPDNIRKSTDSSTNGLIRRGVSSITDDIIRLVENHYGVEPK